MGQRWFPVSAVARVPPPPPPPHTRDARPGDLFARHRALADDDDPIFLFFAIRIPAGGPVSFVRSFVRSFSPFSAAGTVFLLFFSFFAPVSGPVGTVLFNARFPVWVVRTNFT